MMLPPAQLDLTSNPRPQIAERIRSVAENLFASVKNAPLSLRSTFPTILHNNNFALAVHVTKKYAFLEVTSKVRAQSSNQRDRLNTYRELFGAKGSEQHSLFAFDNTRLCRVSDMTLQGAHAFSLGSDVSFCAWDLRHVMSDGSRTITNKIDVLYVVSFGAKIREERAWQEFDTLIRVTLADWSGVK